MLNAAIVGATGYTGRELVGKLARHPKIQPTVLISEQRAGVPFSEVHPEFRGWLDQALEPLIPDRVAKCDVIFSALPHGISMTKVPEFVGTGQPVIDLSGDFRLNQASLYPQWYGYEHRAPALLASAAYGLPEINRAHIVDSSLVANPGCYPTSVLLALKPLLAENRVDPDRVLIDAKSGVSGAGRSPQLPLHFPECTENFRAYKVVSHQHLPEMEQELQKIAGAPVTLTFTPHLVPMIRGIFSTLYVELLQPMEEDDVWSLYQEHYEEEPFIRLVSAPALPETKHVQNTNFCDLSLRVDPRSGRLIIFSVIDNLGKGAAGQAIQNMNLMMGWPETCGLEGILNHGTDDD